MAAARHHFAAPRTRRTLTAVALAMGLAAAGAAPASTLGAGPIRLSPEQRSFAVEVTAPSFQSPGRVRLRYRLAPYDRDWIEAGARREAVYTKVVPRPSRPATAGERTLTPVPSPTRTHARPGEGRHRPTQQPTKAER